MKDSRFFSEFRLGVVIVLGLASSASAGNALLGLWRFNEAGGDVAIDSSGLTNNGALAVMQGETDIKPERVAGPPRALV